MSEATFKERLLWTFASAAVATLAATLAQRVARRAWLALAGHEPPPPLRVAKPAGNRAGRSAAAQFSRLAARFSGA